VQLEQLKRKRIELEGKPEEVERETKVVLPPSSAPTTTTTATTEPSSSSEGKSERSLLEMEVDESPSGVPKSLLQKILKKGEDETPLTTAAVREVQKMQNEKVYQKTIVRIRFPDKTILVGTFHPRHTLKEVYWWIDECLADRKENIVEEDHNSDEKRTIRAMNRFELYISPPKTVLLPATLSHPRQQHRQTIKEWNEKDLLSLGLVPAAVLNLIWINSTTDKTTITQNNNLKEELLQQALVDSTSSNNNTSSFNPFTTGVSLVAKKNAEGLFSADSKSGKGGGGRVGDSSDNNNSSANSSGSAGDRKKPKWFKL
jgi:hypothetical protein